MKPWLLVATGLTAIVISLIATAPPTLLDAALRRSSEGKVRLVDAKGSLWTGAGQIEIRDASGHRGVSKRIAWHLLPESLLRGRLIAEIQMDPATRPFPLSLALSPTRIELADADISLPATALGLFVTRLAPLGLSGDIALHIGNLSIEREQVQGQVTLQLHNAGSPLSPIAPLGDYEVNFAGEGATVRILLRTLRGPLQLDGKGSWANGNTPAFRAIARVPLQQQQQLTPLLRLIGEERGAGSFALEIKSP